MPTKDELLAGLPEPLPLDTADVLGARGAHARILVVIDDHPSGSQSMAAIPILTAWSEDQIEWALGTGASAVYIVTNARALSPAAAEDRYLEVVSQVLEVAGRRGLDVDLVLRTDSTLRGHFPLDVDILVNAIESATAHGVDGVLMVPAFPEAGRITVNSVHYVAEWPGTFTPVGETRFGREPRFPFTSSDLREWVAERTRGRCDAASVRAITLDTVRESPDAVAAQLINARRGEMVVADGATEADLRSIAIGFLKAEAAGKRFILRVGPPFVRAMIGQPVHPALSAEDVERIRTAAGAPEARTGLILVGTPNQLTKRQVRVLETRRPIREIPVSVPAVLDSRRDSHIEQVVVRALEGLEVGNVIVRLAEMHVETEAKGDFALDPRVGKAVNEIAYRIAKARPLKFVVARGGSITSFAAQGLGVRRAMVRGPMLEGIVSLWEPLAGAIKGVPFVVYAGGVGDDDGLADVVDKLSGVEVPTVERHAAVQAATVAPVSGDVVAVVGLGSKGLPVAVRLSERFAVRGFDIDRHQCEVAAREGVSVAVSAREAIDGASAVLVAVRGSDGLEEVLFGGSGIAPHLAPGTVVGVLMAVGVREIRSVATRLAGGGVHLVDAPISGGSQRARRGELVALVGAPGESLAAVRPILEHVSSTLIHVGPHVGDGQAMKAVNQLLAAVNLAGVAEALSLASALGLDPALTLNALGAGAAASYMVADRGPRMAEAADGVTPQLVNRLDVTADDLGVALEVARASAVPTPVAAAVEQVFLRAGHQLPPDADDSTLIRVVEPRLP